MRTMRVMLGSAVLAAALADGPAKAGLTADSLRSVVAPNTYVSQWAAQTASDRRFASNVLSPAIMMRPESASSYGGEIGAMTPQSDAFASLAPSLSSVTTNNGALSYEGITTASAASVNGFAAAAAPNNSTLITVGLPSAAEVAPWGVLMALAAMWPYRTSYRTRAALRGSARAVFREARPTFPPFLRPAAACYCGLLR